jgi:hypothetical protein
MSQRERTIIIAGATVVFFGVIYLILVFTGTLQTNSSSASTLTVVPQAATAAAVAQQAGCTSFTDEGPSTAGGVVDSGTCNITGVKYGVDTFATKDARDSWLVMASKYGVSPQLETDTSVVYKSVNK